jgi:hypothetical protein
MKLRSVALLLTLTIAGCATTPPRPNPSVVEREIVKSILSEMCAAVINIQGLAVKGNPAAFNEHFAPNSGWMAAIETNLKTDIEGSASPSFTLLGPFLPALLVGKGGTAGSYNASVGGTLDQTASVLRDNKRYIVLDTLLKDVQLCPQAVGWVCRSAPTGRFLSMAPAASHSAESSPSQRLPDRLPAPWTVVRPSRAGQPVAASNLVSQKTGLGGRNICTWTPGRSCLRRPA